MSGTIAIVGRPNVGKSALFNRIARRRIAIVHDLPGVTRDRVSAEVEWHGLPFTLIDTGGIGLSKGEQTSSVITSAALDQALIAIQSADVLIHVVDIQSGIVPLDQDVGIRLRKSGKPIMLAVNKADHSGLEDQVNDFARLGYEHVFLVSAIHGQGISDLMDAAMSRLPKRSGTDASDSEPDTMPPSDSEQDVTTIPESEAHLPKRLDPNLPLKLAIVGRPNVGKSSLINALTQSERVIVSPIPGTTRDAVDVPFEIETEGVRQKYLLIDTAGMRKARRVDDPVEFFSVKRSEDSIKRSDVTVLVLDAESGITEQDKKIADVIVQSHKACVIVINKWDLVESNVRQAREDEIKRRAEKSGHRDDRTKRLTTLSEFGDWVQHHLFFLSYAPVVFTSTKSGFQLDRLLETVRFVAAQLRQQVPTALLNRVLADAIERRQPVSDMGHALRFFYATQVSCSPPVFLMFVNRDEIMSETYEKYLAGELRKAFGFEGCPLLLRAKARPKTIEPRRDRKPRAHTSKPGNRSFRSPTTQGKRPPKRGPRKSGRR